MMNRIARICFILLTIMCVLSSWMIALYASVAIRFDEMVAQGSMEHAAGVTVAGAETFGAYLGMPSFVLPAVALLALISGLVISIKRSWWVGWVLNLLAMVPVATACGIRMNSIIYNPSCGLLMADDAFICNFALLCIGISVLFLVLILCKQKDLLRLPKA